MQSSITVSPTTSKDPNPPPQGTQPEHWDDKKGSGFHNPWSSFRFPSVGERLGLIPKALSQMPATPKDITSLIPSRQPDWGKPANDAVSSKDKIKTTWLGHACFLVEFPVRNDGAERGVRVLFDPVFSDRCSPVQWLGPKRFTYPPCKIDDIPEIDAVVISHNHYDHLDTATIQSLLRRTKRTPHFFAPLGNDPYFKFLGVPATHTHVMDWWDSKQLRIDFDNDKSGSKSDVDNEVKVSRSIAITCTPAQHFTGRALWDNFKTLWSSWAIEEIVDSDSAASSSARPPVKVFFAGDTGYRTVRDDDNEDEVPFCPAFETIGTVFCGFDCALIPIGAYLPRQFMSPVHCAPQDSVRLFKDIKAKKALGMHWGTWTLTVEDVMEPPKKLAEECKKHGLDEDTFVICDLGQTLFF